MDSEIVENEALHEDFQEDDISKTKEVLDDMTQRTADISSLVEALEKTIQSDDMSTSKGISFLEMKNNLMTQYLLGLSGVILKKVSGESIQGSSYVDQLVEIRTVMEKIRKTDDRLKYQIDKLVRNASEGTSEADPLAHKANLDNLNDDSDSDDADKEERPTSKKDVYQPPRVSAVPFDDDEDAPKKQEEKVKKKSINRTLIREMQEEFLETPVEIHNKGDGFSAHLTRHAIDKQRYEETYMTRLPETKKDKHIAKRISTMGVLGDEITDFRSKTRSSGSKNKGVKRKSSGGKKGSAASKKKKFRKK